MKRIAILVTHLLGTGHLSRSLILARALRDAGLAPQLISGGMPTGHLDLSGIDFVQLPPVRSDGASFTRLLDSGGNPVTPEFMSERTHPHAAERFGAVRRTCLITELFPFGRRVLREEFEAALAACQGDDPGRRSSSRRSAISWRRPPTRKRRSRRKPGSPKHYDGVLVHSDAEVVPLEASWPVTPETARMLHYTGFIAPPMPAEEPGGAGRCRRNHRHCRRRSGRAQALRDVDRRRAHRRPALAAACRRRRCRDGLRQAQRRRKWRSGLCRTAARRLPRAC